MSKQYDFYRCMHDFQEDCVPLPDDINDPVIEVLKKIGCDAAIPDIVNIQKHGNFGQYKVLNKNKPTVIYVFKYQSGMIINWDVVTTIEREGLISEITNSYKNKFVKIEKRKRDGGSNKT